MADSKKGSTLDYTRVSASKSKIKFHREHLRGAPPPRTEGIKTRDREGVGEARSLPSSVSK